VGSDAVSEIAEQAPAISDSDLSGSEDFSSGSDSDSGDDSDFDMGYELVDEGTPTEICAEFLREWHNSFAPTNICLTGLLSGLQQFFPGLPKTANTILKTPRTVNIRKMGEGTYYYIGIKSRLSELLELANS